MKDDSIYNGHCDSRRAVGEKERYLEEEVLVKQMFAARRDPKQFSTPQPFLVNDGAQATLAGQFLTTCFFPLDTECTPGFTITL